MSVTLVLQSKNGKTGNVSATYASIDATCPKTCALKDAGCYAQLGMVNIHTVRLNKQAVNETPESVAREEARLIRNQAFYENDTRPLRLHVAGDCRTNRAATIVSTAASKWRQPVWSYTHAWRTVKRENWNAVSILASVEKPADVTKAFERGYAVALVVDKHPEDGKSFKHESGEFKIIPCPAQTRDVQCTDCKLCWKDQFLLESKSVISFAAHGVAKKRVLRVLQSD